MANTNQKLSSSSENPPMPISQLVAMSWCAIRCVAPFGWQPGIDLQSKGLASMSHESDGRYLFVLSLKGRQEYAAEMRRAFLIP
jgi:hypothetical protein